MAYDILSFDGWVFADHFWHAGVPYEAARATFASENRVTPRTGNTSIVSMGAISPHRLTVDFTLLPTAVLAVLPAIDELLGVLDPRDGEPRRLVANRNGTTVERWVRVDGSPSFPPSMAGNVVRVTFVGEAPEWASTTTTTASQSGSSSPFSLSHTNAGAATVHPRYRIGQTAPHSAVGTVVGQRYRKRFTLTNPQSRTLGPFPYQLDLGNTATIVSGGKAQADGDDVRFILNGQMLYSKLIGWNLAQSFAWVVIPGMDAGETITIDWVYGNASVTGPRTWVDPDPTKPIPDMNWENGTATSGTTSTLTKTGAGWQTNQWRRGKLYMLSGANAGTWHTILSNTATVLTTASFASAIAAGDAYLIVKGANDRWIYAVRQTLRQSDYHRGRFYVDKTAVPANDVRYDAPGSWAPELVADNRDSFGIKRSSYLNNGASALDTYALLDAYRMWEGNDARVPQPGTADGMSITTPVPITALWWERQFDNPNGIAKTFVGVRQSGAEDWASVYEDDAATSGLTTISTGTDPVTINTDFPDAFQVVTALIPYNDEEIDLDWRRDTGSATSGTTTTTTDAAKEWETDQFDNGYILMLSGANTGRRRAITGNTATVVTHAAFPAANADGDRYVLINKRLKARLMDGDTLEVTLNDAALTASAWGAETAVYDCAMTLWIGAGPAGSAAGQHRALIGYATNGEVDDEDFEPRRLFLASDEQVEIDAELRRIRIWNTTSSTYTGELTDPTVVIQFHDGTAWRRSADWLPFGVGAQQAWLQETNIGTLSLSVSYEALWLGA